MIKYKCSVCCKECIKIKDGSRYVNENNKVVSGKRCVDCALKNQRIRRNKDKNKVTRKYEKTKNGFYHEGI